MTAGADNVRAIRPNIPPPPAASEPKPPPLKRSALKPPPWLTPTARSNWRAVVPVVEESSPGWLSPIDVPQLGLMFEALANAIAASKAMRGAGGHTRPIDHDRAHGKRPRKHPAVQVFRESVATYTTLAKELGLTPVARVAHDLGLVPAVPADDDAGPDGDIFDA